jgi:carboxyl-terminal processing protease
MRVAIVVGCGWLVLAVVQDRVSSSSEAAAYLNAAIDVMQQNFLHRDRVDWPELRRKTLAQAAGAQVPVDTYPAIRFALAKLSDHHSYLQLTPELTREETARQPKLADPAAMPHPLARKASFPYPSPFRTRRVPEGALVAGATPPVAQIVVPQFSSDDHNEIDGYASAVQRILRDLAAQQPCGWIVDLRGNGGGNVWPMRAGIGPLLGNGDQGATVQSDGTRQVAFYENGRSGVRGDATDPFYARTTEAPVKLEGLPPVAVLIDRDTGSSGEAIAIAFRERPDTRFFGELTYGAATSTFPFTLSDGAKLYLVTGVMVDRKGHEYPDGVPPDQEILSEATISTIDPVLRAASTWLDGLPACAGR